jgi:hypothetical protein
MDDALQRVVQGASLLFNQGNLWLGLTPEQVEEICNSPGAFHGAISIISGAWVNACVPGEAFLNHFQQLVGIWIPSPASEASILAAQATFAGFGPAEWAAFYPTIAVYGILGALYHAAVLQGIVDLDDIAPGALLATGGFSFTGGGVTGFLNGDQFYQFSGPAFGVPGCPACMAGGGPSNGPGLGLASTGTVDLGGLGVLNADAVLTISTTGVGIVGDQATGASLVEVLFP